MTAALSDTFGELSLPETKPFVGIRRFLRDWFRTTSKPGTGRGVIPEQFGIADIPLENRVALPPSLCLDLCIRRVR